MNFRKKFDRPLTPPSFSEIENIAAFFIRELEVSIVAGKINFLASILYHVSCFDF